MIGGSSNTLIEVDDCWNRIGVWGAGQASCPELEQCTHCRNCQHYSAAGRRMLERPIPPDYRSEWTQRLAAARQEAQKTPASVLVFRLGDEWLGLNCRHVQEVTEVRPVHSLPHKTSSLIKGLVNLRGELRLCVSLGSLLQIERANAEYRIDHEIFERMICSEKDGNSFVFPVSEVSGIERYTDSDLTRAPATLARSSQRFTSAVLTCNSRHVGVLDHELLFYALNQGLR